MVTSEIKMLKDNGKQNRIQWTH